MTPEKFTLFARRAVRSRRDVRSMIVVDKNLVSLSPYSAAALAEQERVRELLAQSRALLKQMQAG